MAGKFWLNMEMVKTKLPFFNMTVTMMIFPLCCKLLTKVSEFDAGLLNFRQNTVIHISSYTIFVNPKSH